VAYAYCKQLAKDTPLLASPLWLFASETRPQMPGPENLLRGAGGVSPPQLGVRKRQENKYLTKGKTMAETKKQQKAREKAEEKRLEVEQEQKEKQSSLAVMPEEDNDPNPEEVETDTRTKMIVKRDPARFNEKYFNRALELFLAKSYPKLDKQKDLVIYASDETVETACMIQRIDVEMVSPEDHPEVTKVVLFWDGPQWKNMPEELISDEAELIGKWVEFYTPDADKPFIDIRHQFPNWKFRANAILFDMRNKGIDLEKTQVISRLHQHQDKLRELEMMLSVVADSPINQSALREDKITITDCTNNGEDPEGGLVDATHDQLVSEASEKRRLTEELEKEKFFVYLYGQAIINLPEFIQKMGR